MQIPDPKLSRRRLLTGASLGAASLVAISPVAEAALNCGVATPSQTEGPFYPVHDQVDKDNDLTKVQGKYGKARGQLIYVQGQVLDEDCKPVPNALVEIWQACVTGKYNHDNDPNPAPLDPNFQYWGRDITDKEGKYIFRTIIPGEYPADQDWVRPPHIHFKVAKRGFHELTTQMYFAGHNLNKRDRILLSLSKEERDSVIVDFKKANPSRYEPGSGVGIFNIVLRKV